MFNLKYLRYTLRTNLLMLKADFLELKKINVCHPWIAAWCCYPILESSFRQKATQSVPINLIFYLENKNTAN